MSRRLPDAAVPLDRRSRQQQDGMLLAVGVAAVAVISLIVMVVNWLIAHWWVLIVAALPASPKASPECPSGPCSERSQVPGASMAT